MISSLEHEVLRPHLGMHLDNGGCYELRGHRPCFQIIKYVVK